MFAAKAALLLVSRPLDFKYQSFFNVVDKCPKIPCRPTLAFLVILDGFHPLLFIQLTADLSLSTD